MADEHMKKMLNIISHWEMQTKTTVKYHYVPKITLTGPSVGKEGEKLGLLYALLGMLKIQPLWALCKVYVSFLKKLLNCFHLPYGSDIHPHVSSPKKQQHVPIRRCAHERS